MKKLYDIKRDEFGNEHIEWAYNGERYMVSCFANKWKFAKCTTEDGIYQVYESLPYTDGERALGWDTAFYYGTILMEAVSFERMVQISDYYKSLSHHLTSADDEADEEPREPALHRSVMSRARLEVLVGGALLAVLGVLAYVCY